MSRIDPADVIALIPAAGFGTRFPGTGSKEVHVLRHTSAGDPVLLIDNLLGHLRRGGMGRVIIITRAEKADIREALGDGAARGLAIEYLYTAPTRSSPQTIDTAWPQVREAVVVLGFPDIVFRAEEAVQRLLSALEDGAADLVLGITPTTTPHRVDIVIAERGRVRTLVIKPPAWSGSAETWVMAAWKPAFTAFLHETLGMVSSADQQELFVGDVIQKFIDTGHEVVAVPLGDSPGIDAGTADGLEALQQEPR